MYLFLFDCVYGFVFFFFQAEDGIRGAQESRGVGGVYKRQRTYVRTYVRPYVRTYVGR